MEGYGGGVSGSRFELLAGDNNGNGNGNRKMNSTAVVRPRRVGTAGTCTKCGDDYSFCTRCANRDCEERFCSKCSASLPECTRCFGKACEGSGNPDTDCLLPCEANPDCWNGTCRRCKETQFGCIICNATVCADCNKGCFGCNTVCCPKCAKHTTRVHRGCEGCNATSCLLCMMHRNPCTLCGHVASMKRLREAYKATGFVQRWLDSPGLPPDAHALRAQVARCWIALLKNPEAVIGPAGGSVHGNGGGGGGGGRAGYSVGKMVSLQQPAAAHPPRQGYPNVHHARQNGSASRELGAGVKVAAVVGGPGSAQEGQRGEGMPRAVQGGWQLGAGGGGEMRAVGGAAGAGGAGTAPARASLEAVRRFVAFTTAVLPAHQQQEGVTLENIKRFFAGWVDPDVVELYYETTRDTSATVKQCEDIVQQVVKHEKRANEAATVAKPQPPPPPPPPSPPPPPPPPLPSSQQSKPHSAADAAAAAVAQERAGRAAAARAATVERAMARVAVQAEAEREAKEASVADAKTKADDETEAEAEEARRARRRQQEQQEEGQREGVAVVATGAAMSGGSGAGGGGGEDATETVGSLEDRLKKAIDRGDAVSIQSIYDEAMHAPAASMKSSKTKIRRKCRNWLNKRAGEERKQLKASQATEAIPVPRGAGAGSAGAAAAAAWATQRPTQFEIFCPNHVAGYLIGTRGQTVNRLMRESKAKIVLQTYQDRSGHDVVITGPSAAVQTARNLVEQFYRSKGVEPTTLRPPSTAIGAEALAAPRSPRAGALPTPPYSRAGALPTPPYPRAGAFAAPPSPRVGLPNPAGPAEAMVGRSVRAPSDRMEAAGARGIQLQRAPPPPFLSGGGAGGEGGGGTPAVPGDVELLQLLRVARCEHHLERFHREKLDEEVLLDMEREDFQRMGVSEEEQARILNALKSDDDDDIVYDGEDLDQDHPDTCKICFCNRVDILFLPCRHQCTCSGCGAGFTGKPCIICRATVERAQKVIRMPKK